MWEGGLLTCCRLSASGKLLDLAERTLSSGNPVSWVTAIWAAAVIVFLALLAQEAKLRFRKAETRLCVCRLPKHTEDY